MKKKLNSIKHFVNLVLIFLFSIGTFAATVSDNDGSAFITRPEFDSLRNDFQTQINKYNLSIDAKIDEAIASYLAGASSSTSDLVDNLLEKYQVTGCTGGIAWNKSNIFTSNANDKQKLAWNVTLFGGQAQTVNGAKYAGYKNYKSTTYENRMLADDGIITSFQKWEPRMTGSGFAVDFAYNHDLGKIWIYNTTNTFTFYDNLDLSPANRKSTQTVCGGFQNVSYYESTMYSVTYAEFTATTTDPYVISPYSTANEYIVDSTSNFTLHDTGAVVNVEASADFIKSAIDNCSGVASYAIPINHDNPVTGFRMIAKVGLNKAVQRKTLVTRDLVDQCSGNGAMSSGLVLCIPPKRGKLCGKVKGSGAGRVLLWVGDNTSTYDSSANKTSFLINTNYQDFEFDNLHAKEYVRIIFEPDDGTQSLDFKDMNIKN